MSEIHFIVLLFALVGDWLLGEPDMLWSRFPHPVVGFGKAVAFVDSRLNHDSGTDSEKLKRGGIAISLLILGALVVGLILKGLVGLLGPLGFFLEVFLVFVLLAQKSLSDHVQAVAVGLQSGGIQGGRDAVAMIVGRDPATLDGQGVCRAAIESLAENFSDGVVAPAFWYAVFGLPGIIVYKMINTADSMIGYRNEKYLFFGRYAAQIDDLANWLPARMSMVLIAAGCAVFSGWPSARHAIRTAFRDAGLHSSPNAGWPEAAMAGGLEIALGGPRRYAHETVQQAHLNGSGRTDLNSADINNALSVFRYACFSLWGIVGAIAIIFLVA